MKESPFTLSIGLIMGTENKDLKEKLTNALKDSLNLNNPKELPLSPSEISNKYTLSIEILKKYFIILGLNEAHQLISIYTQELYEKKSIIKIFSHAYYEKKFHRPRTQYGSEKYLTYAESFALINKQLPEEFKFIELINDFLPSLSVFINPGGAPEEKIAELLANISELYRLIGGSGIKFLFTHAFSCKKKSSYDEEMRMKTSLMFQPNKE